MDDTIHIDKDVNANSIEAKELTPAEARLRRAHFLALAENATRLDEKTFDEVDSADATMATLILPGG